MGNIYPWGRDGQTSFDTSHKSILFPACIFILLLKNQIWLILFPREYLTQSVIFEKEISEKKVQEFCFNLFRGKHRNFSIFFFFFWKNLRLLYDPSLWHFVNIDIRKKIVDNSSTNQCRGFRSRVWRSQENKTFNSNH